MTPRDFVAAHRTDKSALLHELATLSASVGTDALLREFLMALDEAGINFKDEHDK